MRTATSGPDLVGAPLPFATIVRTLDPVLADRILSQTRVSDTEASIVLSTRVDGVDVWFAQISTDKGTVAELDIDGCHVGRHRVTGLGVSRHDREVGPSTLNMPEVWP